MNQPGTTGRSEDVKLDEESPETNENDETKPFTFLLIGKTGTGKSTTAMKLLEFFEKENIEGTERDTNANPLEHESSEETLLKADYPDVDEGPLSITKTATPYSRNKYCVIDTPGFAGSEYSSGYNVSRKNMGIFLGICKLQLDRKFQINRIYYFLPYRGVPERADGVLYEELDLLFRFFGPQILKFMVIICTNHPNEKYQILGYDEDDIKQTKLIVVHALKQIGVQDEGRKEREIEEQVRVQYLPLETTEEHIRDLLEGYKQPGIAICASGDTCVKCGSKFKDSNMCHPGFGPKNLDVSPPAFCYEVQNYTSQLICLPNESFDDTECTYCKKGRGSKGCCSIHVNKTEHSVSISFSKLVAKAPSITGPGIGTVPPASCQQSVPTNSGTMISSKRRVTPHSNATKKAKRTLGTDESAGGLRKQQLDDPLEQGKESTTRPIIQGTTTGGFEKTTQRHHQGTTIGGSQEALTKGKQEANFTDAEHHPLAATASNQRRDEGSIQRPELEHCQTTSFGKHHTAERNDFEGVPIVRSHGTDEGSQGTGSMFVQETTERHSEGTTIGGSREALTEGKQEASHTNTDAKHHPFATTVSNQGRDEGSIQGPELEHVQTTSFGKNHTDERNNFQGAPIIRSHGTDEGSQGTGSTSVQETAERHSEGTTIGGSREALTEGKQEASLTNTDAEHHPLAATANNQGRDEGSIQRPELEHFQTTSFGKRHTAERNNFQGAPIIRSQGTDEGSQGTGSICVQETSLEECPEAIIEHTQGTPIANSQGTYHEGHQGTDVAVFHKSTSRFSEGNIDEFQGATKKSFQGTDETGYEEATMGGFQGTTSGGLEGTTIEYKGRVIMESLQEADLKSDMAGLQRHPSKSSHWKIQWSKSIAKRPTSSKKNKAICKTI